MCFWSVFFPVILWTKGCHRMIFPDRMTYVVKTRGYFFLPENNPPCNFVCTSSIFISRLFIFCLILTNKTPHIAPAYASYMFWHWWSYPILTLIQRPSSITFFSWIISNFVLFIVVLVADQVDMNSTNSFSHKIMGILTQEELNWNL